jgi:hypothetical protein
MLRHVAAAKTGAEPPFAGALIPIAAAEGIRAAVALHARLTKAALEPAVARL